MSNGDDTLERIGGPELPVMRPTYTVRLGSWDQMTMELLEQILRDAGSIRSAAKVIDVPRSTLGSWASKKTRPRAWQRRGGRQKGSPDDGPP